MARVPPQLSPAAAAPLLCAGITTYAPLKRAEVGPGTRVAVVGLGHLAVRLAKAMGAQVTVIRRTLAKQADAPTLGADDYVATSQPDWAVPLAERYDLILNTASGSIDWDAHVSLLRRGGSLVLLGVPDAPVTVNPFGLLTRRRSLTGSVIGSMRETQEMLDFCAEHGIEADIEVIPIQQVNEAYERVLRSDVRYRFVIDMAALA